MCHKGFLLDQINPKEILQLMQVTVRVYTCTSQGQNIHPNESHEPLSVFIMPPASLRFPAKWQERCYHRSHYLTAGFDSNFFFFPGLFLFKHCSAMNTAFPKPIKKKKKPGVRLRVLKVRMGCSMYSEYKMTVGCGFIFTGRVFCIYDRVEIYQTTGRLSSSLKQCQSPESSNAANVQHGNN